MNTEDLDATTVELSVDGAVYKIVMPDMASDYIQNRVATELEPYELEMLRDMKSHLSATDLVLDIGANIGNHTFYLAEVVGCKVVAFEPNESLVAAMQQSVQLNNNSNRVVIENCALGEESNICEFEKLIPENIGSHKLVCGHGDMQVRTLDEFTFTEPVKMLKIDVEGMELGVLKGAKNLISCDAPIIYVEALDLTEFESLLGFFSNLEYFYWDTFNATPTHLFIPRAKLSVNDMDFEGAHLKWGKKSYELARTKTNYKNLCKKLDSSEVTCKSLQGFERQVKILSKELAAAQLMIADAKSSLIEKKKVNDELEADLAEKVNQRDALRKEVSALQLLHEVSKSSRAEALAELKSVSEELAAAQSQLSDCKASLIEKNDCYQIMFDELSALQVAQTILDENLAEEKKARRIAEAKRSGHYKKLQYFRAENEKIKATRVYRIYELLKSSRSVKAQILFLPKLFKLLLINQSVKSVGGGRRQAANSETSSMAVSGAKKDGARDVTFDSVSELRRQAGLVAWPETPTEKSELPKIIAITDEFTTGCFDPDASLVQPRPDNWQALFDQQQPDLAFIESAWKGNYGSWQFRVANYKNKPGNEIEQLTDYCRYRSKPSVFWNKEDPVHHEKFMGTANCTDYIFLGNTLMYC